MQVWQRPAAAVSTIPVWKHINNFNKSSPSLEPWHQVINVPWWLCCCCSGCSLMTLMTFSPSPNTTYCYRQTACGPYFVAIICECVLRSLKALSKEIKSRAVWRQRYLDRLGSSCYRASSQPDWRGLTGNWHLLQLGSNVASLITTSWRGKLVIRSSIQSYLITSRSTIFPCILPVEKHHDTVYCECADTKNGCS